MFIACGQTRPSIAHTARGSGTKGFWLPRPPPNGLWTCVPYVLEAGIHQLALGRVSVLTDRITNEMAWWLVNNGWAGHGPGSCGPAARRVKCLSTGRWRDLRIHSIRLKRPCGTGYLTSLVPKTSYNTRGPRGFHLSRWLAIGRGEVVRPRCSWALDLGRGKWNVPARSRAVMEGRVNSYLSRFIPDLGDRNTCPGGMSEDACTLEGGHQTEIHERRPLIFGRTATSRRPVWVFQFVVSFREGEAPAEPYTTEKIASSGGPAGASPSLEAGKGEAQREAASSSEREIELSLARGSTGGVRLEGPGYANGEREETRGSLAKLGSVVAGESSAIAVGSSQATRCAEPGCARAAPGRARGPQEADFDHRHRVSWLRREQHRPQSRASRASGLWTRSFAARSNSASSLCSDALGEKVDLAARLLAREPSTLSTFVQDIGTVVGMEIAQVRILEEVFDIPVRQARLSFGHSIGELSALVLGRRLQDGAAFARTPFPGDGLRGTDRRHDHGNSFGPRSDACTSKMSSIFANRSAAMGTG